MGLEGFLRQDLDLNTGVMTYSFPDILYPQELYQQNMAILCALSAEVRRKHTLKDWCALAVVSGFILAGVVYFLSYTSLPFSPREDPSSSLAKDRLSSPLEAGLQASVVRLNHQDYVFVISW
jgi:hypothetical protein